MFVSYIETGFFLKIWYKDVLYIFTAAAATHDIIPTTAMMITMK